MQYSHFGSQVSKIIWTVVLAAIVVGFVLVTVFEPFQKNADGGPIEIRSYQVSPAYIDEVRNTLSLALASLDGDKRIGAVSYASNGTLLVTAPARVQNSVSGIVAEIAVLRPKATPAVKLEAWIVRSSESPSSSAVLNEINEPLQVVQKAQNVGGFELVEKLTLLTRSGNRAMVEGHALWMKAEPTLRNVKSDTSIVASKLEIAFQQGGHVETETEMKPGQFMVLAQANHDFGSGGRVQQVYYIVRSTVINSEQS